MVDALAFNLKERLRLFKDKDQEIFVEPEFIEKDFLQSEKERAKSTIVMFLLAAVLGPGFTSVYYSMY